MLISLPYIFTIFIISVISVNIMHYYLSILYCYLFIHLFITLYLCICRLNFYEHVCDFALYSFFFCVMTYLVKHECWASVEHVYLVVRTLICLGGAYCLLYWLRISTVAVDRMQGYLYHGDIERDRYAPFNFYICFCVRRIRSAKDLVICVVEKILL